MYSCIKYTVVIFWHLPSRSRAGKSRLYLNHRRRSQEELIPCDTQCFYSHLSPPSWNFATNRFELWNRRSRIFWMQQLRPETKNFSGGCDSQEICYTLQFIFVCNQRQNALKHHVAIFLSEQPHSVTNITFCYID